MSVQLIIGDRRFWILFKSQLGQHINTHSPLLSSLLLTQDGRARSNFSPDEMQHVLGSVERRLGERHTVSRYVIGTLVLLGLLGTFWGLTQTVGSITSALNGLSFDGQMSSDIFQKLKAGIQSPLSGMGVAFSSSIFGLIGSMILGFLDLQQGKAEKEFYDDLEDGLTTLLNHKVLSNSGPTYILALLEQTAEVLNAFENKLMQIEDNRLKSMAVWQKTLEHIRELTNNLDKNQVGIRDLCELLTVLVRNVQDTNINMQNYSEGQIALNKIEQTKLEQVTDELTSGRRQIVQDLTGEIRMIAKMISMLTEPVEDTLPSHASSM